MKRRIFSFLTAAAVFVGTTLPVSARTTAPSSPSVSAAQSASMSQLEQSAAELVNRQRAVYGLEPLVISDDLSRQARVKAQDMQRSGYFSHTSPSYGSPFAMMQALGVSYRSAAENIAMGYRSAAAVVAAWMESPSHRAIILSDRYTEMGIGYADGYWAQWLIR